MNESFAGKRIVVWPFRLSWSRSSSSHSFKTMNRSTILHRMGLFAAAGLVLALSGGGAVFEPHGAAPVAKRHVVEIKGFGFEPAELTVAPGDTVVWINRDLVPHTATAEDEAWDSGTLGENASWQMIASAKGRHHYFCRFHPTMKSALVVE